MATGGTSCSPAQFPHGFPEGGIMGVSPLGPWEIAPTGTLVGRRGSHLYIRSTSRPHLRRVEQAEARTVPVSDI
jgi:hypothetical protein